MILEHNTSPDHHGHQYVFKVGHHANHIIYVTHARPFGLLCPEAISYTYARLAITPYVICCCVMQGHIIYICQACYTHLL